MPQDRLLHPKASRSQKVTSLTDFEYRVWTQYMLSADDFGVMRHSGVTLQADNDALNAKPRKVVQRALDLLVTIGLVGTFDHQGRSYTYQRDWQTWQKVEYPRATLEPKPPAETIAQCDEATRNLFGIHPGGARKKLPKDAPNDSGNVSQIVSEGVPSNARARVRETANANGQRLTPTANGKRPTPSPNVGARPLPGFNRLRLFRWMVEDLIATLGDYTDTFDLDAFLQSVDEDGSRVFPETWPWIKTEVITEARRRGLPIAEAAHLGKQTTNLMSAVSGLSDRR